MTKLLITTGIYPPDIGGPASFSLSLAKKLSADYKITLITYSSVWKWKEDQQHPFKVIRVWKRIPWFLRHLIYAGKVFWQASRHDRVFVLNVLHGGIPVYLAQLLFKKKFIVKIVGDRAWEAAINGRKTYLMIDDWQKSRKKGWISFLTKGQTGICKKAEKVIVPSQYLARMVRGWGVPENKIIIIYNGVEFAPKDLLKEEARKAIGIAGNILLSVGRLVPWKGFRMLIKIMPQLLRINQFFRLVIVGDGPEYKILQSMVKNLGLDKKVFLVGRKSREELATYLAAAEIFILNTGYEGFSHQILEVMRAGIPVVTTGAGGNREVIQQGANGFMVKYNDEFNLIEAVKTVWQTPELQKRFSEEGKKTVEFFSVEKMLEETVQILHG